MARVEAIDYYYNRKDDEKLSKAQRDYATNFIANVMNSNATDNTKL